MAQRIKVTFYLNVEDDEDGYTDTAHSTGLSSKGYDEIDSAVSGVGGVDMESEVVSG